MNEYKELLQRLLEENVRFLIIGGYAAIAHGLTRATDDLDIWIDPTLDNARKVIRALESFEIDPEALTLDRIADPYTFFRIGDDQGRKIDLMANSGGDLPFPQAWTNRVEMDFFGLRVPFVGLQDLLRIKRAVGRHIDLADIEALCAFHRLEADEDDSD